MAKTPERLFIKVILPKQGAERKVLGGGTSPKPFREVNKEFRQSLSVRLKAIDKAIRISSQEIGAVPVRVKLIGKASAKSHRPETIFSKSSCPIIGAGKLGELFIKANSQGLEKMNNIVTRASSKQYVKELSTIETIEPITPEFRLHGLNAADVLRESPKIKKGYSTKIQLFDLGEVAQQAKLVSNFERECLGAKIEVHRRGYSNESFYYEAICEKEEQVERLSRVVGIRSIMKMPVMTSIRPLVLSGSALPFDLPKPEGSVSSYPIVAVVDSGISDHLSQLNQWVVGRESTVATPYRNTWHGTFVAGLICWAKELNPLAEIDSSPCAVFDLQVLPNDDPNKGNIDTITEAQLLQDLDTALKKHANEIKVWNLSLGTNEVCSLDGFSSFAVELDRLQAKYNVSFVISAGNYGGNPLLDYPRTGNQLIEGRITTPADSVLAITVGAVAHKSHVANGPKKGEPSAFSRHGAGPNHIIKPDLVHFGGSCTTNRVETFGIKSINGGAIGEALGTSFSTPIVSRLLANVYHGITPTPSPVLARALITHHACDPRNGHRVPDTEENFLGFGIPRHLSQCLECSPWSSTLVFEDQLRPGYFLEWDHFPFPNSLHRNGRFYGDVWMTVAFAPETNDRWGTEYCETHIEAHFGVYHRVKSRKTGQVTVAFKGLVPPEHQNPGLLYESFQIEKLRKWAPVRTYFGSLGDTGEKGDRWRLKVRLLTRHGIETVEGMRPQRFALILTIADPEKKAPIYNEMAVNIRPRFKADNLALRITPRIQARPQS